MQSLPVWIYLGALAGAGLAAAGTLPLWRRWCVHTGVVDDPGHRKIHLEPVPLAGGLAVLSGLLLPVLAGAVGLQAGWLGSDTQAALEYGLERRAGQLGILLLGAVGMVALGWWDDRCELRAGVKLAGQCAVAVLVAAAGVRITLFVPSAVFSYAATVLWVLAVTNAMNFLDNMNGLCAGLGVIASGLVAVLAAHMGQYLVALAAFLAAGALLGFLPFNFPRAKVFLGDAGSHLAGYLLAVLTILPHFYTSENARPWAVATPLLLLAVPLGDLAWVVADRWRRGAPIYVGDTHHLSHRLVRRGWSQAQAVALIWGAALALGGLAVGLQWGAT
ncbi:MAG: undecaprenyl/decaprenyl-phosphate alpha-N-acetylglucosaminyl 1-phosphate transferase [Verrucomicrobia bacterium]|nr:undecaprenyl/decaprenyl-phosphate alpha-N-acetylglucosaminyl 1-phosphate transferase [Verrucomicrobiota bacterium]